MTSQIAGKLLRNNIYGTKLERAAAVLPATATATYFTITGGRIILTTLVGEVTAATGATATTLAVNLVGSINGLTQVLCNATSVTSLSLGTAYAFAALATAPTIGAAFNQNNETVLTPGVIQFVTSATNTGSFRWTLMYIPLDDGATVTVN